MPSVCPKSAEKASSQPPEGESSIAQALAIVEKKVRNLEKRKTKLDAYRADQDRGKTLNDDQKAAIGKYGEVIGSLDFARELSGQFNKLIQDEEKERKKMLKKENHERARAELTKVTYILSARELFVSLQDEAIVADFKDGTNGATKLTADQLKQLAEFQLLSTPSRDDDAREETFEMQVATSADHLVNLAEKKDRKVAGTTYKDLADIIDAIRQSGYFEKTAETEEIAEEEVKEEVEVEAEVCEENGGEEEVISNGMANVALEEADAASAMLGHTSPSHQLEDPVAAVNPPPQQPLPMFPNAITSPPQPTMEQPIPAPTQAIEPRGPEQVPTEVAAKPIESLNFFQESQIDLGSPHLDPAVVMVHASFPPQKPSLNNAHLLAQEQQQQQPHRNQPMPDRIPTQTFTNQMYQGMPQAQPAGLGHQKPTPVMGHQQENGVAMGPQGQVVIDHRELELKQLQQQQQQVNHQMGGQDPRAAEPQANVPRPNNGQIYPQENFNQAAEVAKEERARKEKEQSVPRQGGYAAMAAGGNKQTPDSEIGQWNPEGQGGGNNGGTLDWNEEEAGMEEGRGERGGRGRGGRGRGGDRGYNRGGSRGRGDKGGRGFRGGEGGYRGGYRGGDRDSGYRGDRDGGYRGDRDGGYRGEGGYRGDREGGYRGGRGGRSRASPHQNGSGGYRE